MRSGMMSGARWVAAVALLGACMGAGEGPRVRALFVSGTPAPAGLTFATLGRAATNAQGSVCFLSGWDGVQRRREGLYLLRGDGVTPIARTGDPLPGSTGGRFSFPPDRADEFDGFSLNDRDEVAFITRQGLFLSLGDGLRPVARLGAEIEGAADERWEEVMAVSLNNRGALAFAAATRLIGEAERQEGVFLSDGGVPEIAHFVGDTVAGLDGELVGFDGVALNDRGDIAVLARAGDGHRPVILLTTGGTTQIIAEEGGAAPGGRWTALESVALNDEETLVFLGRATDGIREWPGIFAASDGVVTALALSGQPVEGAAEAVLGPNLGRPVIDEDGNVAFVAELEGMPRRQALVLAIGERHVALAVTGLTDPQPSFTRITGLNQCSLHEGHAVCALTRGGADGGDALVRFALDTASQLVLRAGMPLPPGGALVTVDDESAPRETQARVAAGGEVVFAAGGGGYGRALFRQRADGPELLTPLGRAYGDGSILRSVVAFCLNDAGRLCFLGHRDEEGGDAALYLRDLDGPPEPRIAISTGQGVPGAEGRVIRQFASPQIDGQGRVIVAAFAAPADAPATAPLDGYLLRIGDEGTELLAREETLVEGVGPLTGRADGGVAATVPGTFRELQVNRQGKALFVSSYLDPQSGALMPSGLFLWVDGEVRPVALFGQRSPLGGGLPYFSFSAPRLGDDGTISFVASVLEARRRQRLALFRVRAGETVAVAAAGDTAPGVEGARYRAFQEPALSPSGELAFLSLLDGSTAARGSGALYLSAGGAVRLALSATGADSDADALALRMDAASPASPLGVLADGSVLAAARARGESEPAGLYLIPAP
jgi:hypothetical protein